MDLNNRTVLSERNYKAGYVVKNEKYEDGTTFKTAYTPDGHYIGCPKTALFLCKKRGIKPEKIRPKSNVCSIGFCESEKKWYGWSHRAITGFKIGDMLFEEKYQTEENENVKFTKIGKVKIKTLEEAKQAAKNFAKYVS